MRKVCPESHVIWGLTNAGGCRACARDSYLKRTYDFSLDECQLLWDTQKGLCAVCGKALRPLHGGEGCRVEVDHEHGKTKDRKSMIRGLLCGGRHFGCNRRLGRNDKIEWLRQSLLYISDPPARKLFGYPAQVVICFKQDKKHA